jgi:hypothetical protein
MTASSPLDRVLDALRKRGTVDADTKARQYRAQCPAPGHGRGRGDKSHSLAITERQDGKAAVHCFAGCPVEAIVGALDLTVADLYPEAALGTGDEGSWLRSFTYTDEQGTALYRVRRGVKRDGGKRWTMERAVGGEWDRRKGVMADVPRVLYRLHELAANPDRAVWITEGERDADSMRSWGVLATTVASGRWDGVDLSTLAGRDVTIVVDHDTAGWQRGRTAGAAAVAAGARVLGYRRPYGDCEDVTCHIDSGFSIDLLIPVDLDTEDPPAPELTPIATHPVFTADGVAMFAMVPVPAFIALIQRGDLDPDDMLIWAYVEHRAGQTGIAKVTAQAIARMLFGDGGGPRTRVRDSIARLTAVGLMTPEGRGVYRVSNPVRMGSSGSIPTDLFFTESRAQIQGVPDTRETASQALSPQEPNKNPVNDPTPGHTNDPTPGHLGGEANDPTPGHSAGDGDVTDEQVEVVARAFGVGLDGEPF